MAWTRQTRTINHIQKKYPWTGTLEYGRNYFVDAFL